MQLLYPEMDQQSVSAKNASSYNTMYLNLYCFISQFNSNYW